MSDKETENLDDNQWERLSRIVNHIENVQRNGKLLAKRLFDNGEVETSRRLLMRVFAHDNSKFMGVEYEHLSRDNPDARSPEFFVAVQQHWATNPHHPEFYKNGIREMSEVDIAEMVCDQKARSDEKGSNIRDWIKVEATVKYGFSTKTAVYKKIKFYLDLLLDDTFKKIETKPPNK